MKLQEFVSETLREIIAGVKEAQAYATDSGAQVNPPDDSLPGEQVPPYTEIQMDGHRVLIPIQGIDFDVAVTSTDTAERQAGAGIFVAALGIGAKGRSDTSNSSISRIRFSVPCALPVQRRK